MNVFRRGSNFSKQLAAIRAQTHKVHKIFVWENGADESDAQPGVIVMRSSENLGVWARFAAGLNAETDFLWVIDDDTIPGARWLENALATFQEHPGVIGSRGLRFHTPHSYTLYEEFGPNNPNSQVEQVDIVGHNWIFPRSWLAFFWTELGNRFENPLAGEDIHLSFAVKKHLGLGTFVPPHPNSDPSLWGELPDSKFDGKGSEAISQNPKSMRRFELAYAHYIDQGFEPMCIEKGAADNGLLSVQAKLVSRFPYLSQRVAQRLGIRKKR